MRQIGFGLFVIGVLSLAPRGVSAQDSVIVIDPDAPVVEAVPTGPPIEVVQELIDIYNDSATTRLAGNFILPTGSQARAHLALYRGILRVAGTVEGPVTVINGDLVIPAGGVITGDVLVVGGRFTILPGGRHTGRRRVYRESAPVFRSPVGLLAFRPPPQSLAEIASARTSFQAGRIRTTLSLETGRTYNRIEGLPIIVGPTFTLPTLGGTEGKLDAQVIFRTAGDQTGVRDEFGYTLRSEWIFSGTIAGGLGGQLYSVIESVEQQPLSSGESGWSAFLLSRDYRDYFETRGGEIYGWLDPSSHLHLEAGWRRDQERSVRVADPARLFRNNEPWRPNPLIDDGHYSTFRFRADVDTRNNKQAPTTGWLIQGEIERSSSDDASPVALPSEVRRPIPTFRDYRFTRIGFDVRRYSQFSPSSRVNLRVVGGGWLAGDPLPLQRRVSLGGPDLLPGSGFRAITCAPATFVNAAQPALCDRYLATQIEVRTRIHIGLTHLLAGQTFYGLDRLLSLDEADIVIFGNAGHGWLTGEGPGRVPNNRIPRFGEWRKDVGVGIDTGSLGLYLAKSVSNSDPVRFTVRLERRF